MSLLCTLTQSKKKGAAVTDENDKKEDNLDIDSFLAEFEGGDSSSSKSKGGGKKSTTTGGKKAGTAAAVGKGVVATTTTNSVRTVKKMGMSGGKAYVVQIRTKQEAGM